MAVIFLSNTVRYSAVDLRVTDSSDVETSDASGIDAILGGPRHLSWTQSGTAQRRIVFVNKSGGLQANYFVGINFNRHNTHSVTLKSWSTYTSSSADAFANTNFTETLIGLTSKDWVYSIGNLTSKQAFGLVLDSGTGGAYTKTLSPFYFSQGITFDNQEGDTTYQPVSRHAQPVKYKGQYYHLEALVNCVFTDVSRTTLNSYQTANKEEPVFLYDSSGNYIEHYLWHSVILEDTVRPIYHDMYELTLSLGILRHWP